MNQVVIIHLTYWLFLVGFLGYPAWRPPKPMVPRSAPLFPGRIHGWQRTLAHNDLACLRGAYFPSVKKSKVPMGEPEVALLKKLVIIGKSFPREGFGVRKIGVGCGRSPRTGTNARSSDLKLVGAQPKLLSNTQAARFLPFAPRVSPGEYKF